MRITPTSVFLLTFLLASASCWWEIGHMTVAQIAANYLKDQGHEQALNKFTALIDGFANLSDGRTNTFVEAAVWSDDIKEYNVSYFDDYHFTDIVFDPHNIFAAMSQFQKDVNSINVMNSAKSVLKTNKDGVTFERCFMARFLLHVVGDIHQPLHSVSMYNESLKTGDLGGNRIKITTSAGNEMNLHAFMDSMAGQQKDGVRIERPLNEVGWAYIRNLAGSITKEYPPEHFTAAQISELQPHAWTVESYNEAAEKVYPFVFKNKQLSDEYSKDMFNLCRERVALGGYRLANTIIDIYK